MNAVHIDPSERIFAPFYEPRPGPRFSRKTLLAIGITAVAYGAIGVYFVTQKYEGPSLAAPPPDKAVVVQRWLPTPPPEPQTPVERQVAPRNVEAPRPTHVEPLPIAPVETPTATDIMPTVIAPTVVVPSVTPTPPGPPQTTTAPSVIRNPVWISRPTPEQVGSLYPERAAARDITGSATLWCGIRANGTMTDCQVVDESPTGWRFGATALSMAQYFRISPRTVDGKPVEGSRVRIPVVFSLAN